MIGVGIGIATIGAGEASATSPTIIAPGSVDVSSGKIGTAHTITAGTATATQGGTISYEYSWLVVGVEVATTAAYTPVSADDMLALQGRWRAVETVGVDEYPTAWQQVLGVTVTWPAPVAAGALSDQTFTDDTGNQTYDVSGDFTGSDLTFSLTTAPGGVTINGGTGVVTFDTDALTAQSGISIVVRATNSGGYADSGFSLTISPSGGDVTAPVVDSSSYDAGVVTMGVTEASGAATVYWALVANPSAPTAAQVEAGTGGGILEAGSFVVEDGANTDVISVTDVTGDELHLVLKDASGNSTGDPSLANNTIITGVSIAAAKTFVAFNTSTWEYMPDDGGPTTSPDGFTMAMKVKIPSPLSAVHYIAAYGFDSYIRVNADGSMSVRAKDKNGTIISAYYVTSAGFAPADAEVAFLWSVSSTGAKLQMAVGAGTPALHVNQTYSDSGFDVEPPRLINAILDSGTASGAIKVDVAWMANTYMDPATNWSDFFDAANDPKEAMRSGSTIGGVTPAFAEGGDAAAWNALTGMTGTVADA